MDDAKPDMPVIDPQYHASLIKHAVEHGRQSHCRACVLGVQLMKDQTQ